MLPFNIGPEPLNVNQSISLVCSITEGDMPIEIQWLFSNQIITPNLGANVLNVGPTASILNINSVQSFNSGPYTCLVRNRAGNASYSSFLNINGINIDFYL